MRGVFLRFLRFVTFFYVFLRFVTGEGRFLPVRGEPATWLLLGCVLAAASCRSWCADHPEPSADSAPPAAAPSLPPSPPPPLAPAAASARRACTPLCPWRWRRATWRYPTCWRRRWSTRERHFLLLCAGLCFAMRCKGAAKGCSCARMKTTSSKAFPPSSLLFRRSCIVYWMVGFAPVACEWGGRGAPSQPLLTA